MTIMVNGLWIAIILQASVESQIWLGRLDHVGSFGTENAVYNSTFHDD